MHYRDPGGALGKHIFELNHVKSSKVEEDQKKKRKFIPNSSQLVARPTRNKLIKEGKSTHNNIKQMNVLP